MGTLYIVPTPIGNLEDMTLRGLRILKEVSLIAAEDTRTSRVLLDHYEIKTPLTSYHEHNKLAKLDAIFDALARGDVALISDAGTPGISDPGYELIREAITRDIEIVPLPGANAVITAVVGSGLPADSFIYLGFLPKKQNARRDLLHTLKHEKRTLVAYESPHRLADTLGQIRAILGDDRPVCVGRELTKRFEDYVRGTAEAVHQHFVAENPKGEITLVIGGAPGGTVWSKDVVLAELERRTDAGESLSRAAKAIAAESGWKKSNVYALGVED
ncbi:16S rRNA (cytidine(1402)-2'-O)-methyltransferase [Phototrophicus methaneseepsis]|uniref:Ribosomal RNA small subunit methyltransferase I n=1 Tax=Phototrophicus methaneseepsis TaxID=2710758 RepID=A0A7S8EC82_9CHLR|nr:16S rRNA (cytidine(1402)-2'-O)-methyltransferase [Phototrophicus methaneseepsis]QPC84310.1 16S rRNA (cytidine(1402)-2'-O)-methyltransferase [Phototrophicus methaneseepsis]